MGPQDVSEKGCAMRCVGETSLEPQTRLEHKKERINFASTPPPPWQMIIFSNTKQNVAHLSMKILPSESTKQLLSHRSVIMVSKSGNDVLTTSYG
jgi:hypothetical protein